MRLICFLSTLAFLFWAVTRGNLYNQFNEGCYMELKRAVSTSSRHEAYGFLEKAKLFLQKKKTTSGSTSIVFPTDDDDLGKWYNNITKAQEKIISGNLLAAKKVIAERHPFKGHLVVHIPHGVSAYPNNLAFACWGVFSLLIACASLVFWIQPK